MELFKRKYTFVELIVAFIILVLILLIVNYMLFIRHPHHIHFSYLVTKTKYNLDVIRDTLKNYKSEYDEWPESISVLEEYFWKIQSPNSSNPQFLIKRGFVEYISNQKGCGEKHENLDSSGGWYYNNETGEIKVNINKPLKDYFLFYWGIYKDEIPSKW